MGKGLDTDGVHQIIADRLAPYLGANMARASVGGHLEKLEVRGGTVTDGQIETLLERLGPGLSVFIGPARSGQVIEEIRAELAAAEHRR